MGLKTDFKNAVPNENGRRQRIVQNGDGTVCIQDATVYTQAGDSVGAAMLNATNAAVNGGAYFAYTHTYAGGVHALLGEGAHLEFTATAAFADGDTITVNGTPVAAKTTDGEPLAGGYWVAGSVVQATLAADGGTLFFKSGGSALNFKVLAAESESALPAIAAENTLAVITTTPINGWAFSATAPAAPQSGMVWVQTSATSTVAFNALKKQKIEVYPIAAKQYVGGTWAACNAFAWQNGAWHSFTRYLYNAGTAFVPWEAAISQGGYVVNQMTMAESCMYGVGGYGKTAYRATTAVLDLSSANTLYAAVRCPQNGAFILQVTSSAAITGAAPYKIEWTTGKTLALDISAVSAGRVIVGVCANSDVTGYVDKIWVE